MKDFLFQSGLNTLLLPECRDVVHSGPSNPEVPRDGEWTCPWDKEP